MSKRSAAVHKRLNQHEGRCDRQHSRIKADLIGAMLAALGPYLDAQEKTQFRRDMADELAKRKRKGGF